MLTVWYKKGVWYGIKGFYMSTEYTDERFFFGTLEEAKEAFCKQFALDRGIIGGRVEWMEA